MVPVSGLYIMGLTYIGGIYAEKCTLQIPILSPLAEGWTRFVDFRIVFRICFADLFFIVVFLIKSVLFTNLLTSFISCDC